MFRFQPLNMYHFPSNLFSYITVHNVFSPIQSATNAFGLATTNRRGIHALIPRPWGGIQPHPRRGSVRGLLSVQPSYFPYRSQIHPNFDALHLYDRWQSLPLLPASGIFVTSEWLRRSEFPRYMLLM